MARLFRPTFNSIDPKTGEKSNYRSEKWYADYNDADGIRRRVALSTDKASSQTRLAEIIRTIERQKAGLIEKVSDVLGQPLQPSVDEYKQHLESKSRADKHISETIRLIRNVLKRSECVVLGDLQRGQEALEDYLLDRHEEGVSHRTINADLGAIRSFCRWLIKKKRITVDPTVNLEKLDVEADRRRKRRSLTDDEAARVYKATLESKEDFRGLSGRDRAMLYMLAQRTGLRRRELLTLTPRAFKFETEPPTVRVEVGNSKHRKEDLLPLPAEVAEEMSAYLKGKHRSQPIWAGTWWEDSAEMFRMDLAAAGIPIIDEDGYILDFHGQRTTFISGLARAGVSPAMAQKLARHSDVNLTMKAYTHLHIEELAGAVEKLPSLRSPQVAKQSNDSQVAAVDDADLKLVVEAWPTISREVRQTIVALIIPVAEG